MIGNNIIAIITWKEFSFRDYWRTNFFNYSQQEKAQSHCNFFRQGGTEMIDSKYNN